MAEGDDGGDGGGSSSERQFLSSFCKFVDGMIKLAAFTGSDEVFFLLVSSLQTQRTK